MLGGSHSVEVKFLHENENAKANSYDILSLQVLDREKLLSKKLEPILANTSLAASRNCYQTKASVEVCNVPHGF
jgi:hypothetical protein